MDGTLGSVALALLLERDRLPPVACTGGGGGGGGKGKVAFEMVALYAGNDGRFSLADGCIAWMLPRIVLLFLISLPVPFLSQKTHLLVVPSFSIPMTSPSGARQSSQTIRPSCTVATRPERVTSMSRDPAPDVGKMMWSRSVWGVIGREDVCGHVGRRRVACHRPSWSARRTDLIAKDRPPFPP